MHTIKKALFISLTTFVLTVPPKGLPIKVVECAHMEHFMRAWGYFNGFSLCENTETGSCQLSITSVEPGVFYGLNLQVFHIIPGNDEPNEPPKWIIETLPQKIRNEAQIEFMQSEQDIVAFCKPFNGAWSDPMDIRSISKFICTLISYVFGEATVICPSYSLVPELSNNLDCKSAQLTRGFSVEQRCGIYL